MNDNLKHITKTDKLFLKSISLEKIFSKVDEFIRVLIMYEFNLNIRDMIYQIIQCERYKTQQYIFKNYRSKPMVKKIKKKYIKDRI